MVFRTNLLNIIVFSLLTLDNFVQMLLTVFFVLLKRRLELFLQLIPVLETDFSYSYVFLRDGFTALVGGVHK